MIKSIYHYLMKKISLVYRVKIEYFRIFKKFPNIENPTNINEKILKRILFEKDPKFAFYADKYAVRSYISESIGSQYLIPLIAVYSSAHELNHLKQWDNIVIKPTHGAGMVKILDQEPDISEKKQIITLANNWLQTNFSQVCDEWHYSLIVPKLVVEKKITNVKEALKDYKFHRFLQKDGSYKQILQIVAERSELGYETVFFDVDHLDKILHSPFGYIETLTAHEKEYIQKIVLLNHQLCSEYNYVRLDWYILKDKIYFGEITFTPGAGRSKSFAGEFGIKIAQLWNEK